MRQVADMGYGDAYSDSVKALNSRSGDVIGVTAATRDLTGHQHGGAALAAYKGRRRKLTNEVRHPLSAIVANANAAQHWLNRPNPDLAEALAALARIVRDGARIDEMI